MPDFGIMRGFNEKLFGDKLVAGQLPTQLGLIGSTILIPFLLDAYPNAAASYSLRLLKSSYSGSAVRVRRSSDNTEQDIGFTASGNLDTSALLAFTGTGALDNGFVTTWYDQSGNGVNALQTIAISQPQIVSSGAVITQNSKPILRFNNQFFQLNSTLTPATNWSIFGVGLKNVAGQTLTFIGGTTSFNSALVGFSDNNIYLLGAGNYITTSDSPVTSYRLNSGFVVGGPASSIYRNNVLLTTSSVGGPVAQNFLYIGRYGLQIDNSSMSEVILYQSNQLSNNSGINTNIITYYGL
jgi:hypothetical protein